jgi:hypothetical protein
MMTPQLRGVSNTTIHIVAATQIRWKGANTLSEVQVLYPDPRACNILEIAPDGFGYLFQALDLTVAWLISA